MICPKCGTPNDESFRFCLRCGNPLEGQAVANVPQTPAYPQPSSPPLPPPSQPVPAAPSAPVQQPPASYQTRQAATQYPPATTQYAPPAAPQQQAMQQQWSPAPYYPETQAMNVLHIWGPFAGFGTRRKHLGWLLDNRGDCADQLTNQVKTLFQERQIQGMQITEETLTARGLIVENRPYFILHRRLASVGLYINQFGKDLFISLVSYLKPPISNLRVLVLAVITLFWFYTTFIFPSALQGSLTGLFGASSLFGGSSGGSSDLAFLLCVIGPLGFLNSMALGIFVVYSLYKWLNEKDLWAGLRTTPNEFNEDDLMAMEKAAEQTVRIALDDIGLNPDDLRPTALQNSARII